MRIVLFMSFLIIANAAQAYCADYTIMTFTQLNQALLAAQEERAQFLDKAQNDIDQLQAVLTKSIRDRKELAALTARVSLDKRRIDLLQDLSTNDQKVFLISIEVSNRRILQLEQQNEILIQQIRGK